MGSYAKGNPLALKVLGSNLYDKGMREWESEIVKWERTLDMEIQKILRMSSYFLMLHVSLARAVKIGS